MMPRASKAFFIPADPPSPLLAWFVITNSGKSQKSQGSLAAAPACLWWWARGGAGGSRCWGGGQRGARGPTLLILGWGRGWSSRGAALMWLGLGPGGTCHLSWIREERPLLWDQDFWEELIPLL